LFSLLYAASAGAICWYLARRASGRGLTAISVVLAVSVLVAAPILPEGEEDLFLIGYFPPNVYHNPTMLIAKPLLVLTLMSAVAGLVRVGPASARELLLLAAPLVLLGVAKPNYLGCVAPALVACGILDAARGGRVSWVRIAAVAGAAVATVAATLLLYRSLAVGAEAGIVFAPLVVIANYADTDAATIGRSLLASLAFPLAVTLLWPRAAWHDPSMRLAWIGTVVGLFFSYFIAEAGTRMYDGNFLWTGQMAVFVLFVAAAGLLWERTTQAVQVQMRDTSRLVGTYVRLGLALVILWQHVASGLRHVQIKVAPSEWLSYWT
jgi:hypothetical protein